MKEYLKVIAYLICFILIIVLAIVGYNFLTTNYLTEEQEIETKQEKISKATDFEVLNSEGNKVKLSDFFGKPIVVNFWATWCGPCRSELPEFEKAYGKYNNAVEILMVNLTDGYNDTVESVKEFVKENEYEFPLYFDTEISAANAYNIYSIPQTMFIDKDGNILKSYTGVINEQILEKYINKLK